MRFWIVLAVGNYALTMMKFQPFLRFWRLVEELAAAAGQDREFQPFLRFWLIDEWGQYRESKDVSTLLEILGLVCLVVVGF